MAERINSTPTRNDGEDNPRVIGNPTDEQGRDLLLIPHPSSVNMQRILAAVQVENRPNDPIYIRQQDGKFLSWSNYGRQTIDGAAGSRDVVIIVSHMAESGDVIPRRPLNIQPTPEDVANLIEQGVRKECHQSDLLIMMMRYILNQDTSVCTVVSAENTSVEQFKIKLLSLMQSTQKNGVVLHYIGPGQKKSGNWCFKDGFISFEEIMELYTRHLKPMGRVFTIVSDCSYSGRWVKEAMTFMDGQGVGPCGHQAKEKGILLKMYASCQENETPIERIFSTQCITNDRENGNMIFKIHLRGSMMHHQDPSGLDFTGIRCNRPINHYCGITTLPTWRQWGNGERIHVQAVLNEDLSENISVLVYMHIQANEVEEITREIESIQLRRREYVPEGTDQPRIAVGGPNPPRDVVGRNLIVNYSFGHL